MHVDGALAGEVVEHVGVFGGDGGGGDLGRHRARSGHAGVGEAVVGAADGADQDGDGADGGAGNGARHRGRGRRRRRRRRRHCWAASSLSNWWLKSRILPLTVAGGERELLPVVDHDYFGGEAIGGGGHAAAKRGENDFLRGAGGLAGPGDQFAGFRAANPVGDVAFSRVTSAPRARISAAT